MQAAIVVRSSRVGSRRRRQAAITGAGLDLVVLVGLAGVEVTDLRAARGGGGPGRGLVLDGNEAAGGSFLLQHIHPACYE